ncbi:hypothetical protein M427DRAFT_475217 [Gonapodya prolifera JEL478]|uniref:Uncharacterized protein n=1 Tax=Gonapodya prolifera (strain JEL478) TaxID=1344416 RepID=A0A139A188_GONPJ|nr:hypothetical protein M427DRAFT_475217 [Gonapodya prolifera JEL478]|eukprot:KXS10547.1 hypothetical protein M427DRAFT_475217 [Gonapodya prolifera JEL478]
MVEPQFLILKELQLPYPKWADLAAYSTYQTWRSHSEVADTVTETYRDPDTGMEVLTAPGDWLHSETPASESTLEAKPRNRVVPHPATGEGMGGNLSIYGRLELDRSIP